MTDVIERVRGSGQVSDLFNGGPCADQAEQVATQLCEKIAELHMTDPKKIDPEGFLADPRKAADHLTQLTAHNGLFLLAVFRYESFVFDAQKLRLVQSISPPHDEEGKRRVAYSVESMGKAEQFLARVAQAASGYFSVMPYLRDAFQGPRFDQGYPEMYPVLEQLDTGEVVVKSYRTKAEKIDAISTASTLGETARP